MSVRNIINGLVNKIGDLSGNGITEASLALAVKNDRSQLANIVQQDLPLKADQTALNNSNSAITSIIDKQISALAFNFANIITSRGATFSLDANNNLMAIANEGIACPNIQLASTVKELTFALTQADSQINLGGDIANFVGVKVGVQASRLINYTVNGGTIITYETAPQIGIIGDIVNVKVSGNIYTFKLQKNGVGAFVDWFVVDKSSYTTASWTNTNLGIGATVNVDAITSIAKNIYLGDYLNTFMIKYNISNGIGGGTTPIIPTFLKWNSLGDSITYYNRYQPIVMANLGITALNNYGVGGTCITATDSSDGEAICVRGMAMDNTADLITILGGINDYYTLGGKPLGVLGDNTKYTFYGALKVMIEGIVTNNPTARIAFFTPLQCVDSVLGFSQNSLGFKLIDYVNAIKQVCELKSIPVLDLYGGCGINQQNGTTFIGDGVHPNTLGWARMAKYISGFLKTL